MGKEKLEETRVGNYLLTRVLGQGTYGKVRLGEHIATRELAAIKIIEKSSIQNEKQVARIQREIRFLKLLHHPNIVKVYEVEETAANIYIVMEYAEGGELFDYIVAHKRVREKEARAFFRMMISAMDYCHQNSVIHRDLKPENLLLDAHKQLRIIDFGFGNNFRHGKFLETFCGSPFYAAPEMILGKRYLGPEVDMWSLGVILYAILVGHLPFDDDNMKELYRKISSGAFTTPEYLAPGACHLIGRLLTVDPKRRASLSEVKMHEWVLEGYSSPPENYLPARKKITEPSELDMNIVVRLGSFQYSPEDVTRAFFEEDPDKSNPIRSTYFLLAEMLSREETRIAKEKELLLIKESGLASPVMPLIPEGKSKIHPLRPKTGIPTMSTSLTAIREQSVHEELSQETSHSMQQLELSGANIVRIDEIKELQSIPFEINSDSSETATIDSRGNRMLSPTVKETRRASLTMIPEACKRKSIVNIETKMSSEVTGPRSAGLPLRLGGTHKLDEDGARRYSVPAALKGEPLTVDRVPRTSLVSEKDSNPSRRSATEGQCTVADSAAIEDKQGPRSALGWFLNASTTSRKSPADILCELERVLTEENISFVFCDPYTVDCQYLDPSSGKSKTSGTGVGFQVESMWKIVLCLRDDF